MYIGVVEKTKTSTSYAPNNKGDVFKGGHWAGASGGSDWIEKDFSSPQLVTGIHIGRASTDITTKGFRLVLKLKKSDGKWIIIDELHDTNINRTALSGGAIGKSIPSYTKKLSPAIKATAFRLEFYGHGWFDATDIRLSAHKSGGKGKKPITIKDFGGYWQLVEEKGSIGRECSPKERYNDYYRDTVAGFGNHIVITKMIRKGNEVYCKMEAEWQRPPAKLYPGSTINLPVTIRRLADSGKYSCDMTVYFDMHDMECGFGGVGGKIGSVKLDRKGPKSLHKAIHWKVKEPFHKKAGEKLTIRVCYSGGAICGKNRGMKYYYI